MIWILILNHLYLGDLILILKSSTYDDFAHLWTVVIDTSMERSSRVLQHGKQKNYFIFKKGRN